MKDYKNIIYILTNPLYAGYVKIGYASDLYQRLSSLNTGMLRNYEPYAVYETTAKNTDRQFHAIIDDLAPIVRARVINGQRVQDKEFFKLEPEQAYDILRHIAIMTGTESRLHRAGESDEQLSPASPYRQQMTAPTVTDVQPAAADTISTNKRPISYEIGEVQYPFTKWTESLIQHCEQIISGVGFSTFKASVVGMRMSSSKSSKRKIFSDTEADMHDFNHYKFKQGELYLLLNYNEANIRKINKKLDELYPTMQLIYKYSSEEKE